MKPLCKKFAPLTPINSSFVVPSADKLAMSGIGAGHQPEHSRQDRAKEQGHARQDGQVLDGGHDARCRGGGRSRGQPRHPGADSPTGRRGLMSYKTLMIAILI